MRIDFVNEVSRILDIKRKDLIEKDLILHQILVDLSKNMASSLKTFSSREARVS